MKSIQLMVEALISKGFSQTQIAQKAGTTQPSIHRALNGSTPKFDTGKKIEALYKDSVRSASDSE